MAARGKCLATSVVICIRILENTRVAFKFEDRSGVIAVVRGGYLPAL